MSAMIKAQRQASRKALTGCFTALAITLAILLAGANLIPAQQNNSARRAPANVQFAAGRSALNIPFEFEFNQIVLLVRVNDSAPIKFLFDTGAGISILSARRGASLKLKQVDTVKATGVGGSLEGSLASGVSLSVPGVAVLNQRLAVLPLNVPFCEGKNIEGIIGYDFIKEFVVEINYETRTLSLFEPSNYQYKGHGEVFPLIMKGTPRIHAQIGVPGKPAIEGLFEIDTGSDGVLTINSPFVNRQKLVSALTAQVANIERGLGGESKRIDARLGYMQLGSFKINAPLVGLSIDTVGSMAAGDNDGPIGNEIMRRFKVTIDYSRQRMMLEPNSSLSDPYESDMSGIVIDAEGKNCRIFKVEDITEQSPAAESGILAGDEIVAVDGRPANQFTSARIEKLLMQDGAVRSLTLRRDGKVRVVTIKLRRRI
ncbi:MAG TPA: aspartyl protease family protein [Pyrinomonadaceae bacterium]|nr:aspartyl protease family protein [Pyrinomonadaceae bacterium]